MVGTGAGARMGVLIRNAEALERIGAITAVLFDTNRALTTGHVYVVSMNAVRRNARVRALALATLLEID